LEISAVLNTPIGKQKVLLFERNETQAKGWRQGGVDVSGFPYDFSLQIDGYVGVSFEGDVGRQISTLDIHIDRL
jgi:hypothetical protein